jgi:hypothetical protein
MPLREFILEEIPGYISPKENELIRPNSEHNYMFKINGFVPSINKAFYKFERGCGDDLNNALFNAYMKVIKRFESKYGLIVDVVKAIEYYKLDPNNNDKGTGSAFYNIEEDIEEYNKLMNDLDGSLINKINKK